MRLWRKLFGSITESEKAGQISDGALLFWMFLVAKQDDQGRLPYHKTFMKVLCASRDWPWSTIEGFCQELITVELVSLDGKFIFITKGSELNGAPDKRIPPMLYPEANHVETFIDNVPTQFELSSNDVPTLYRVEESKVEESKEEESKEETHNVIHDDVTSEKLTIPLWWDTLSGDKRWGAVIDWGFIRDIDSFYGTIDLPIEARKCLQWATDSTSGKRRKDLRRTWLNWLDKMMKDGKGDKSGDGANKDSLTHRIISARNDGDWMAGLSTSMRARMETQRLENENLSNEESRRN